jgi:hypothetical protein
MDSWVIKIVRLACPVIVVGLPVLMLYGGFVPWQAAEDALAEYRGSPKLLVGGSYSWHSRNGQVSETTSRTYLLIPQSFTTLSAVTVVSTNGRVEVASSRFAIVAILVAYALSIWGTWYFWLRPSRRPEAIQGRR